MLQLPCMLVCSFVCANRTRDRGCSKHPVFPVPSIFEKGKKKMQTSGERAARTRSYISVIATRWLAMTGEGGAEGEGTVRPTPGGMEPRSHAPVTAQPASISGSGIPLW
jgi:hypothetical protein